MTQAVRRLLQALPSHRLSYEQLGRTKLTSTIDCHLGMPLGRHAASPALYAPSKSVQWYSTSQMAANTDAGQAVPQREPDKIVFSAGQPAELPDRASKLLSTWQLTTANKGITRQYTFSSFSKAWKFMSLVSDECKIKKHHPSWSNLYNKVTIEWTTHKPEGLSIKDVEMAEFCDRTAHEIGQKTKT